MINKEQLRDEFHKKKTDVEETYRKGCITEYELAMKIADLYNEYALQIGLIWLYENRTW